MGPRDFMADDHALSQVRGGFRKVTAKVTAKVTLISVPRDFIEFSQVRKSRTKSRHKVTSPLPFRGGDGLLIHNPRSQPTRETHVMTEAEPTTDPDPTSPPDDNAPPVDDDLAERQRTALERLARQRPATAERNPR